MTTEHEQSKAYWQGWDAAHQDLAALQAEHGKLHEYVDLIERELIELRGANVRCEALRDSLRPKPPWECAWCPRPATRLVETNYGQLIELCDRCEHSTLMVSRSESLSHPSHLAEGLR